ncbi:hypothetical protein BaRGS_00035348 [Batillaria attramentaria]|uniref:Novel STAND NTPase 3 domain-containing protein n=1 Tax=Batillaria attramentaria TaxID=370345 RepID=A0ABD0JF21_9CAEN
MQLMNLFEAIFKKITVSTSVYSSTEQKNITTDDEKEGKNVNVIVIVIPVVLIILLLMCATVIFFRCRSRNSSIREFDKRVESHPLVPIRSPRMAITEATENSGKGTRTVLSHDETVTAKFCEFTQEEVFGKFGKYIYNRTLQLLQKTGAVVITGPERCGKSTLGRAVLDHFSTMGFYPLLLDHPNLWWKKKHDDKKHVVLLDECKFDVWSMKTVKSMLQDDLCYIMFVLRSDVMISECSGLSKLLSAVPIVDLGKKVPTETGHIKQLLGACKSGDLEKVITILSGGVDPNWSDREGKTPLHIACEHGQADIVSHLIWGGCDVNFYDKKLRTPLHYACKGLRQNSDDVADSDDKDVFSRPESKDCPRGTIVKSLIASGARLEAVDTEGKTPLHMACEGDSYEMVNIMLQAGANVKAKDKKGYTPLHVTCGYNNRDVTKSLVDAKSDVDASDNNGLTPLHVACINKATDCAEILLRANASVNARINAGKTPLHMACYAGSKEIVDMLLDKGADVEVMDNKGVTPKADAKSKNHEDIARIVCPRHAYH